MTGTGTEATSNIYIDGVDTGTDTDGSGNLSVSITVLRGGSFTKTLTVVDSFGNLPQTLHLSIVPVLLPPLVERVLVGRRVVEQVVQTLIIPPHRLLQQKGESMAGENQNVVETPIESSEEESVGESYP